MMCRMKLKVVRDSRVEFWWSQQKIGTKKFGVLILNANFCLLEAWTEYGQQ